MFGSTNNIDKNWLRPLAMVGALKNGKIVVYHKVSITWRDKRKNQARLNSLDHGKYIKFTPDQNLSHTEAGRR